MTGVSGYRPVDMDATRVARALHGVIEPFHAYMYFAQEVQDAYEALGLEPRGEGYVAGRAAPLGAIGPATATATFFGFNPQLMAYALPGAWAKADPATMLAARASGIQAAYERLDAPTEGLEEATALAQEAVAGLSFAGRPLAAANAEVPLPGKGFADLWQAVAVLREHRGDGHLAVLVVREITPVEALALYASWQDTVSRRFLQRSRLWDDAAWEAGCDLLRDRGWMDGDGGLTDDGADVREAIEADTDRLAAAPYAILGEDRSRRLFDLLLPVAAALNTGNAFPRQVDLPTSFG